ncbi:putative ABC multidrug transporter [Ascobolus immersus RN42]|uniref:Putative ABC multidrug transporter n=1 Tax=Ascobolus immersus RN42 TaxID=1160509 RepID=A0A3N4HWT7_ASCIM|nr:putative ABC multidrug transporter [Ascobolus immersus RN42]
MSYSTRCARIDDTFGPHAKECRDQFDFTLLFHETILSIAPLAALLLFAPNRIIYLFQKSTKVVFSAALYAKIISLLVFAGLQLALLILWTSSSTYKTKASVPAAILSFVGSIIFVPLSYAEHVKSVQPSALFTTYLLFSLLFDIARARTLWLAEFNQTIATAFTAGVALKAFILVLECMHKRTVLREPYKAYPPEATSGIINRSVFWWLNQLFRRGFGNLLFIEDLFVLDKHLKSDYLQNLAQNAWDKVPSKNTHTLFAITLKIFRWPLLAVVLPRLALIGFNFSQPFLIERAIKLSTEPVNDVTTNYGYGLIGAYILAYTGIAVSTGSYQHLTYRAITMLRGGLVSMLYKKTTDLSMTAVDPVASLTLMSADIERITTGWQYMHEIWANMIEIGVAIYLLERQLGVACAVPVAVAIVSMIASIFATSLVMSRQAMWLEAIEKRIAATTAMLSSMKGVKMCGLTEVLAKNIQNLRLQEIEISKKFRKLLIWNMGFAYITPVFAPIVTFGVFSALAKKNDDTTLDISRVFVSLSLFALLSEPLTSLIMSLASFMGAVSCMDRIQKFLQAEPRKDSRRNPSEFWDQPDEKHLIASSEENRSPRSSGMTLTAPFPTLAIDDTVVIDHGEFGWDSEKEPLLHDISLRIPTGKLTYLIGPVGCGKSTLLKAILGEVSTLKGTVQMGTTSVAFCDQTPWHMNGTVQQSILGVSEFEEGWYGTVIRACALDTDLKQLPSGDQTVIGSKGIALSGGQSQRIALARAIYARKDFVILDDCLSGLDSETENRVFHSLLGANGLLRRFHTTVLIASSSAKRLPYSDQIIALDATGRIAEYGRFDDLNSLGGYISGFTLPAADWTYKPNDGDDYNLEQGITKYEYVTVDHLASKESADAEANRRFGDLSIYLYYIRSIGWTPTSIFIVCITLFIFCQSFPNIWVKWWAQHNAEFPNERLGYYLGIYVLLGGCALIFLVISCWQMIITMVPRSGENFHWELLRTVLHAPMSFFATTDTGVTINRFSQDLQLIDMELPVAALNTFATFVLCIAQMALIAVASVYAAIAFPAVIATLFGIQKYYLRTSRQLRFMDLEAKSPLYTQFMECLQGLATIRAFGWQKQLEKKSRELLDRSQRPFYLLFAVQRWLTLVLDLVVGGIAVLLIILVVKLRGTMSSGYVGVALLNVILFSQSLKMLVTFWTTLETHIGAIARVRIFTHEAISEDLPSETNIPPPDWPSQGSISFNGVSAGYNDKDMVVKDLTLSITPGEKIGICGRTGSGKSSLMLTLFRMVELSSGSITIDGIDISTIPRQELRSRLIGVPQDAILLVGNVRLNADPHGTNTDESIEEALRSVTLWDIIVEKGGLDANVDDLHLSHGQRQLFCLARALLRPSKILILDEATSSVDARTDELMQRIIREKFSKHTILAVAHKLDTILDFDRIALLESGRLSEVDKPDVLLASPSAFKALYEGAKGDDDIIEVAASVSDITAGSDSLTLGVGSPTGTPGPSATPPLGSVRSSPRHSVV